MTHHSSNYDRNYQGYYEQEHEQYADFCENENQDFVENSEDPPDLEGYPDVTELYARNGPLAESQQQVEDIHYRKEYSPGPNDYYYNVLPQSQPQHRTRVPRSQRLPVQNTSAYFYPISHHTLHSPCPLTASHSLQVSTQNHPPTNHLTRAVLSKNYIENYNLEGYHQDQNIYDGYDQGTQNFYGYTLDRNNLVDCQSHQERFQEFRGKKINLYKVRTGKSGGSKKYPVTVKTPKYINKNQTTSLINKKPSALCLPVVTQPDPGLVKRKSRTHHHIKRAQDQTEPLADNDISPEAGCSYSAHQMHSEGDVNKHSIVKGLDNLLDQFVDEAVLSQNHDAEDVEGGNLETETKIREFCKFLKPRIPASIRAKQEKMAKMKASLNMTENFLQPKMKMSLDKLLNRLQKCEISESGEKLSEKSFQSKRDKEDENKEETVDNKHQSFNYETLSRKMSASSRDQQVHDQDQSKIIINKPSTSLATSLDDKASRSIRPLDDNCALDLHRSKSYIVDLIDRALSKELGTVPRTSSIQPDMTPKRAVATISRHRQSTHKELCYEVTAALTDSFISNATVPPKQPNALDLQRANSEEDQGKKICRSMSDDTNYIKQLKQLRWGHIRHIQHEARKLAELEEFLEKCGEIDY